jgi:thiol-disulfide isomerase/thioredoxin
VAGSLRVRPRLLVASLVVASLAAVGVGAWWSLSSTSSNDEADDGVVLDRPGEFSEPTIATNAPVAGTPLPVVDVRTASGDALSTTTLVGAPLVVNVWFADCPPCRRELPAFAAAHATYGERVRFVGVNPRDTPERARSFAEERGVRYEGYFDPDGAFLAAAGIATFPSTLLVDAAGTIVVQRGGEVTQSELEQLIEQWLLS